MSSYSAILLANSPFLATRCPPTSQSCWQIPLDEIPSLGDKIQQAENDEQLHDRCRVQEIRENASTTVKRERNDLVVAQKNLIAENKEALLQPDIVWSLESVTADEHDFLITRRLHP